MSYIEFVNGVATRIISSNEVHCARELYAARQSGDVAEVIRLEALSELRRVQLCNGSIQNRHDWKSFDRVTEIAAQLTSSTGKSYLPTDAGEYVFPRFDIMEVPKVGDEVSYSFNGDCYPDGVIVKITANNRFIWTSNGHKYLRQGKKGSWIRNGTWALIQGHHFEQNPEF